MIWQAFKESLWHLLYPAACLHCHESISPSETVLCEACAGLLELIDPEERCPYCFEIKKNFHSHACQFCQKNFSLFYRMGAAFDYIGPAATLVKKLKYANQPHLAKGLAAFLVVQLEQLEWPLPDALVPVPISFSHWFSRGYNQSALIAQEMANLLQIPMWDVLKRKSGDFSQAGLTLDQRSLLSGHSFRLKKKNAIKNKTILLIDDVMTSGKTLQSCAECLMEGTPAVLYTLTCCKTLLN